MNLHRTVIRQYVSYLRIHISGKSLLPVCALTRQRNRILRLFADIPYHCIHSFYSGMQIVLIIIRIQLIRHTVNGQLRIGNPVAVSADDSAKIACIVFIAGYIIITKQDILHIPVFIRYDNRNKRCAVIRYTNDCAALIFQHIDRHRFPMSACSK